jgi:hypothetical protein
MKYIVTVRGMLEGTPEQAKLLHNEIVGRLLQSASRWGT